MVDTLIIGAGLAGLTCARRLTAAGASVQILEAAEDIGGRVRTDEVDGFLLDRGFQVLLTAYPECRRQLDYPALDLRPFYPGSLVRIGGRFHRLADPWRRPHHAPGTLLAPVGSFADKLRVARLRARARSGSLDTLLSRPETSTREALLARGFSTAMIDRFFQPFLGGVFLDRDLATTSRMLEFVFRWFSLGDTVLPAAGMQAIPRQLAAGLEGRVRTGARVDRIARDVVILGDGESIRGRTVVLATDGLEAARLGGVAEPGFNGTTCLYFAAPEPPIAEPILVLDGDGIGPINHLCVPSQVAPHYAPTGSALVSVSVVGDSAMDDAALESAVRGQLRGWFGKGVGSWRHLRTYRIPLALPAQVPPTPAPAARSRRLASGVFVCGDHTATSSIQGAMSSGRRAAEDVLAALAAG